MAVVVLQRSMPLRSVTLLAMVSAIG